MRSQTNPILSLSTLARRAVNIFVAICFGFLSLVSHPTLAQSGSPDFEAPVIEHEEVPSGTWGDTETFVATVVDNDELDRVSLFYRYAGDTRFTEVTMTPLAASSYYTASVDTSLSDEPQSAIEYYIRAEDVSGNLVVKGFTFEPLVRELITPAPASTSISEAPVTETPAMADVEPKSGINWLYVGLGVLLLGGIAAGAGGGGDGGGGSDSGCDGSCQVTLTLGTP